MNSLAAIISMDTQPGICFEFQIFFIFCTFNPQEQPHRSTNQPYLNPACNTISGIILQAYKLVIMNFISRFFDLMTTLFFILWMLLHLFESYELSQYCLIAVIFFAVCMVAVRLFIFYKITQRRLEDHS